VGKVYEHAFAVYDIWATFSFGIGIGIDFGAEQMSQRPD
jgi:hypothetical protein